MKRRRMGKGRLRQHRMKEGIKRSEGEPNVKKELKIKEKSEKEERGGE